MRVQLIGMAKCSVCNACGPSIPNDFKQNEASFF